MTEKTHAHQGLPEFHLHGPGHDMSRRSVVRRARVVALLAVCVLAAGFVMVLIERHGDAKALETRTTEETKLHVSVVHPNTRGVNAKLTLPSTVLGQNEAQVYARTPGYVKQWTKDIGQPVKAGELLAIIDTPEINQQVMEATANYNLAKTAFDRWTDMRRDDAVSQQELDEKTGAYRQSQAALQRLRDQQAFGRVVAPFDGIVTKRNVNIGDLVNAGNGGAPQSLFSIAQVNKLHMYVFVPQDQAALIQVGDDVSILRREAPGKPLIGKVLRTAGAIDTTSRTLQVEIEVPNQDHGLMPGAYVEVALSIKSDSRMTIPNNTLLFSGAGAQVGVVGEDNKVRLQPVTLGTDYGLRVEVKSGLKAGDSIIINPPDSLISGRAVTIVKAETAKSGKGGDDKGGAPKAGPDGAKGGTPDAAGKTAPNGAARAPGPSAS
ncbi:MAG TPA: efflux RND transporter periplasmic adaptor subunit [Burkholderiales bacterium]|jgi:RND family efflux transporter MFP subunit